MDEVQQFPSLTVEDYMKADTSVWWDAGSCWDQSYNAHLIVHNIRLALHRLNYQGKISVYVYGSEWIFHGLDADELAKDDIYFFLVPFGGKENINMDILSDVLSWVGAKKKPSNILLISEDPEFSDLMHHLRQRKYNILLALPDILNFPILVLPASTIWQWDKLLSGQPPDVIKPITCLPGFENAPAASGGRNAAVSGGQNAPAVSGGWIAAVSRGRNAPPPTVSGGRNAPRKIWIEKGETSRQ